MRDPERKTKKRAIELRRRMPDAEIILWSRLRRKALPGFRFRRQHPIGPYIADFACPLSRLVVEVDGGTHSTDKEVAHDRRRDAYMKSRGWRVFRVNNLDVYKNLDMVLEGICRFAPLPGLPPSLFELRRTSRPDLPRKRGRKMRDSCAPPLGGA